eukprot:TRINITY_DN6919_c0_g1_i1.p1 TRINITY_DN6919_c0_g1~~TRINITY_DN6919_c0_g1_i1.p1  ORF type:complete len:158 (-),score=15.62 TRINITY_DN6919_c0_g1_i1:103-576(-)
MNQMNDIQEPVEGIEEFDLPIPFIQEDYKGDSESESNGKFCFPESLVQINKSSKQVRPKCISIDYEMEARILSWLDKNQISFVSNDNIKEITAKKNIGLLTKARTSHEISSEILGISGEETRSNSSEGNFLRRREKRNTLPSTFCRSHRVDENTPAE